jgi:hypothetical protein
MPKPTYKKLWNRAKNLEKECNGCNHIFDNPMGFVHALLASIRQILLFSFFYCSGQCTRSSFTDSMQTTQI